MELEGVAGLKIEFNALDCPGCSGELKRSNRSGCYTEELTNSHNRNFEMLGDSLGLLDYSITQLLNYSITRLRDLEF